MLKTTELLCKTIFVNDFLRFAHFFEQSGEAFADYCVRKIGFVPEDIINVDLQGACEKSVLSARKAYAKVNEQMPLIISSVSSVNSHFVDVDESVVPTFEPNELFSGKINFPDTELKDCKPLVEKAIGIIVSKIVKKSTFQELFNSIENYGTYFSFDSGTTSLFEFLKIKAAHASCQYIQMCNDDDESILVCSFDFLGIKEFKFRDILNNDLRLIRASSLYIDIFRERVLDKFLAQIGLTRANVIFCGGRHIHMFLPNTTIVKEKIKAYIKTVNDWCVEYHKTDLYVSYGYAETSREQLKSVVKAPTYYLNLFVKIASIKAEVESHKYTAENIIKINEMNASHLYEERLIKFISDLKKLCSNLDEEELNVTITSDKSGIPIFPDEYISVRQGAESNVIQVYVDKSRKTHYSEKEIGIWMFQNNLHKTFDTLSANRNVSILRIDIDDFRKRMLSYGGNYESIPKSSVFKMMLSKEFAIFLRYYVYLLVSNFDNVIVVHEGADDVFFVGDTKDIYEFAFSLSTVYRQYTNYKMTISAGLTSYPLNNSFLNVANEAQELMNKSKMVDGKNAITILDSLYTDKWERMYSKKYRELLGI